VVQGALKHVLEPIFEHEFAEQSYGFRPGRGSREAVKRVEELLESGHTVIVDVDLKSYFDTIPHEKLIEKLKEKIQDGKVVGLIEQYLKAGVMESLREWKPTEKGTPQGSVISPLLSNLYLNELDHEMARRGWEMVRYADDFVVMCRSQAEAEEILGYLKRWTEKAGLILHPTKTRVVNYAQEEGFEFLGWHFVRGVKFPRKKSVEKFRDSIRDKTRRTSGESFERIISSLNRTLRGWHGYFGASVQNVLAAQDGWVRKRLRAILRKRNKRPGSGRSLDDHKRWTNQWFSQAGLWSLYHGSTEYS
jgi:RNA-directed DNA polymerase